VLGIVVVLEITLDNWAHL